MAQPSIGVGVAVVAAAPAAVVSLRRVDCIMSDVHRKKAFKSLISFGKAYSKDFKVHKF